MMTDRRSIKLNMEEYQQRKNFGKCTLLQKEKEARLYALAKKLNVKIGGDDR